MCNHGVTSRKGRVSRNDLNYLAFQNAGVTSRKGRVSRNLIARSIFCGNYVTSRKGRVSRNAINFSGGALVLESRPARGV